MGIATQVEMAIDELLVTFVASKSAALSASLIPLALTGATIHFILIGWAIARGVTNDPFQTIVSKIFRVTLIASVALSAGVYQANLVEGVTGAEGALIHAMSGFDTVGALVDDMARPFAELGQQLYSKANVGVWPNFGLLVAAGIVAVAEFITVALGLGFYLLAKVALVLTLSIGPLFLLFTMWPATEKYTELWIGQVFNYVLLKVLVASSIAMLMTFASQFAAHVAMNQEAVNMIKAATALLICSGALAVVMLNLPQLASALCGGASISGIGRTIGRALLDTLNKTKEAEAPPHAPGGGQISPGSARGKGRETSTGPLPPPRLPLFQRNTIAQIRKAK